MTRPAVGICVAVHPARFGPWDQDVAMVPATLVTAVHELRWLPLLLIVDEALATEPEEALRLLDGMIVPEWLAEADRYVDFSRRLGEAAEARGLPVLRLPASLLKPATAVAEYSGAMRGLFTSVAPSA